MTPQDPTSAGDPSAAPDDSSDGVTVSITAESDGTFTVQVQGDSDGGDASDGPASAPSIAAALKLAGQMLGQESQEEAQEGPEDDNEPMQPDQATSAWNQMAASKDKARSQ